MRLYYVTYDYLIGGKYWEQRKRFFAKNAKEACKTIKDNYFESLSYKIEHGFSPSQARRDTRYPFHIKAKRID